MYFGAQNYTSGANGTIPEGNYRFKVVAAEEKLSSKGNEMIELELAVFIPGHDGAIPVFDRLVSTERSLYKIEQFCKSTGQPEKFIVNNGFVQGQIGFGDCINRSGSARFAPDRDSGYLKVKWYNEQEAPGAGQQRQQGGNPVQFSQNPSQQRSTSLPPAYRDGDSIPF